MITKTLKTINNTVAVQTVEMKQKAVEFMKEDKSAKGATEEGYLTYGVVVLGVLILAIAVAFLTGGFESIGSFFTDGISGRNTNPNGWGN